MLPEAKGSLCLLQPPPRCLLPRSLGSLFGLPTKGVVRVFDAVLLAVALDLGDAAIPCLPLGRIARPLPQLGLDVGGQGDPRRDDRRLAALRENLIGYGQLAAGRVADNRNIRQLGFELRGVCLRDLASQESMRSISSRRSRRGSACAASRSDSKPSM